LPEAVLYASVTRARELFATDGYLRDSTELRQIIDLPPDLSIFEGSDKAAIDRFLRRARLAGTHKGYIASTRKAWWSVGLRAPAPILATYMARRPPIFVRNLASARHINIAHGLYPREKMASAALDQLALYLSRSVSIALGRTYAGGLTKFEPREMERIPIPANVILHLAIA